MQPFPAAEACAVIERAFRADGKRLKLREVMGEFGKHLHDELHLIRFHGVLAPNAGLRGAIVPGPGQKPGAPADEHADGVPARMGWARLLERVFEIDLAHCSQCGGAFRIIAAIEARAVIVGILMHQGLPARAPPRSPARPPALFQAA